MHRQTIDELPGTAIKNELINVVKQQIDSENFEIFIEPGSDKGDNFMGNVYRVVFQTTRDKNDTKKSSLILKVAPQNQFRRQQLNVRSLFLREISMYDKVLSYFNEFQLSKGINLNENGFNEYPKFYSSISDDLSECVFLEDLNLRHFKVLKFREEPVSFGHMSLLMTALGKFHAVSFALKDQQPDKFKQLSSLVFEHYWTILETDYKKIYNEAVNWFTLSLEESGRFDMLDRFNQIKGNEVDKTIYTLVSGAHAEPYSVICHGDLTTNNSMFKKDDQGKPIEIQLIDWQFCRYASPATELVLYLLCSTTKELRDKHYDEFLKIYHGSLSDMLIRLGSDPHKIFTYEALLDQLRKFGIYSVFVGTILMGILYSDISPLDMDKIADNVNGKIKHEDSFQMSEQTKRIFKQRVIDMFEDMARFGYI